MDSITLLSVLGFVAVMSIYGGVAYLWYRVAKSHKEFMAKKRKKK